MRNLTRCAAALVFGLGTAVACAGGRADEEKIPLSKVPKPVIAAVEAKFSGAVIKQAEKEEEEGKTIYELGITHDGHSLDVSATADGTIVAVEKQIKPDELPAAVSAAIKAKYPKAKIKKAEEVEEEGKTTFEVIVEKSADKSVELVLDKSGKILEEEDAGKD